MEFIKIKLLSFIYGRSGLKIVATFCTKLGADIFGYFSR